jgi:hypothetical protein
METEGRQANDVFFLVGKEQDFVPSNFGRTVLTYDAVSETSHGSTDCVLPSFVMYLVLKGCVIFCWS